MRSGTMKCTCGHSFWVETAAIQVKCPQCQTTHSVMHLPIKQEVVEAPPDPNAEIRAIMKRLSELLPEEGEFDGTDI